MTELKQLKKHELLHTVSRKTSSGKAVWIMARSGRS